MKAQVVWLAVAFALGCASGFILARRIMSAQLRYLVTPNPRLEGVDPGEGPPFEEVTGLAIALSPTTTLLRHREPVFAVYLANTSSGVLTIPTYHRDTYIVRVWDGQGRELTDQEHGEVHTDYGGPTRKDWVSLPPGGVLRLTRRPISREQVLAPLVPGVYRAAVTLKHQKWLDHIPEADSASGDTRLKVWTPPDEPVDEVASIVFEVR